MTPKLQTVLWLSRIRMPSPPPLAGEEEGGGFFQCLPNYLRNSTSLCQHFMIPKAENQKSLLAQPVIALSVTVCCFAMLAAIDFNDYPLLQADEIENVWAHRSLPAKSDAANLSQSQMLPQQSLGIG